MAQICRDCRGENTFEVDGLDPVCPRCGSCCECYCPSPEERRDAINPACGHLQRSTCPSCAVCMACDGCYCGEG
jgi:hypothetical protein